MAPWQQLLRRTGCVARNSQVLFILCLRGFYLSTFDLCATPRVGVAWSLSVECTREEMSENNRDARACEPQHGKVAKFVTFMRDYKWYL